MRELKKYPNRRLYDLTDSHYITVEDVRQMIIDGESIHVSDSKDGSNITRSVLLQILTEQEAEGHEPVLTDRAIEQIIRFYGKNFGGVVSRYIEQSILTFLEHQDQFQRRMREMSDINPLNFVRQAMDSTFGAAQSDRDTSEQDAPPSDK